MAKSVTQQNQVVRNMFLPGKYAFESDVRPADYWWSFHRQNADKIQAIRTSWPKPGAEYTRISPLDCLRWPAANENMDPHNDIGLIKYEDEIAAFITQNEHATQPPSKTSIGQGSFEIIDKGFVTDTEMWPVIYEKIENDAGQLKLSYKTDFEKGGTKYKLSLSGRPSYFIMDILRHFNPRRKREKLTIYKIA